MYGVLPNNNSLDHATEREIAVVDEVAWVHERPRRHHKRNQVDESRYEPHSNSVASRETENDVTQWAQQFFMNNFITSSTGDGLNLFMKIGPSG